MEGLDRALPDGYWEEENDFLKLKMMLEHGAEFGFVGKDKLPPEIENRFLRFVLDYEKAAENIPRITVFEKIGSPAHFLPLDEIPKAKIEPAWEELSKLLETNGIDLCFGNPEISPEERYRFVTEELFEQELEQAGLPEVVHFFLYESFHPDTLFDIRHTVEKHLLPSVFSKGLFDMEFFFGETICWNNREYEDYKDLDRMIKKFKNLFDAIRLEEGLVMDIGESHGVWRATGNYSVLMYRDGEKIGIDGTFSVNFEEELTGNLNISDVTLEGIKFPD